MSSHHSPALVGRHAELRALESRLAETCQGTGRLMLLSGEAGVGKSHLLRAFVAKARATGTEVLAGSCYDEHPAMPYGPFVDATRRLLRQRAGESLSQRLAGLEGELAPLVPGLAPPPPDANQDTEGRKWRIFEAFSRLLVRTAAPLQDTFSARLLVLEDLHWADGTSLELLAHLAREAEGERTLVVASYRRDDHEASNLSGLLERLTRERRREEIRLLPLTREELSFLAERTLGRVPPSQLVQELHDRSGGNPFYAEELLHALQDDPEFDALLRAAQWGHASSWSALPVTLREGVLARTVGLEPVARETLTFAAVMGRHFTFDLLLSVTGLEEAVLVRALESLIRRGLIFEEAEDRYAFRHALTREAVYGELLGRDRRLRHQLVLRTLEALDEPARFERLEELAHHSLHARDSGAARYARQAGSRAAGVFAYREALTHFDNALRLSPGATLRERAELLDAQALSAWHLAQAQTSERAWDQARPLFTQLGDHEKVSEILRYQSTTAFFRGDLQRAFELLERALDVLKDTQPGVALALARSALARLYQYEGQLYASLEHGEAALRLARQLADQHVLARCLQHLGVARAQLGDLEVGRSLLQEAYEQARTLPCLGCAATSRLQLGTLLALLQDFDSALAAFAEAEVLGHQSGLSMASGAVSASRAAICLERGQIGLTRTLLEGVLSDGDTPPSVRLQASAVQAELHLRQGHPDAACAALEKLVHTVEGTAQSPGVTLLRLGLPVLARARFALGDLDGAQEALGRLVSGERLRPVSLDGAAALGEIVEVLLATGRREDLEFVMKALSQVADTGAGALLGQLHDARGLFHHHAGHFVEAAEQYRHSVAVWQAAALPYREGRTRRRLAEALLAARAPQRDEARRQLGLARGLLEQTEAALELEAAARLAREHGLHGRSSGPELTRREREVLRLLAGGLPNRGIGVALGISERTVEVHVTNILAKLEVTSRVQAATYALQHQLTNSDQGPPT